MFKYDTTKTQHYCKVLGLQYKGDNDPSMTNAMLVAARNLFTQVQFDEAMWLHLFEVKQLFNPKRYNWKGRVILALHFIFNFL